MKKGSINSSKPEVVSIADLADDCILALASKADRFYKYGDSLVEPILDPESTAGTLKPIGPHELKWYLRRMMPYTSEAVLSAVADDILYNPELPVKRLRALVTVPTFREDFSLITDTGFDEQSGFYYLPDPSLANSRFTVNATRTDALASKKVLFELLADFPFARPNDRYSYLATLLTLFLRSSIRAVVPALGINGNGPSVGKG